MVVKSGIKAEKPLRFRLDDIKLLSLHSDFFESKESYQFSIPAYKVQALIVNDNDLHLIFGIMIQSKNTIKNDTNVLAEIVGIFHFEEKIPKIEKLIEIPLAANLLALLYPFLREKISYCLSANRIRYFLKPVNVFKLLENLSEDDTLLVDRRDKNDH